MTRNELHEMTEMKQHIRTCIGCGKKTEKSLLLRYVFAQEEVVRDIMGNMPGRGAYVCDNECFARALKRGAFRRSLKK